MTGYIAEMRKLVGHRTIMQCAVSIICVDAQNRILMGKRSDNHKWGYSGGAIEIDEKVEDCAKRELYEEMGLIADELEFFCVNSGPEAHYIYPNGDEVSNFEIVYICRKWHGELKATDGEMEELRFFSKDEIDLSEISPPIRHVVFDFLEREEKTGKRQTTDNHVECVVLLTRITDDSSGFVSLGEAVPDALLDIRYYSDYNFVGERIDGYEEPLALMTKAAASALRAVSDELMEKGYRLKVYDAYRPQMAVDHFIRWAKDPDDVRMKKHFYPDLDKAVLFPQGYIMEKSGHSRGSTVDLTLVDRRTGEDLDMGGTFDYFGELSHSDYRGITGRQYSNRMLLRDAMTRHGFKPLAEEWWHFTLKNEPYPDTYFTFPVSGEAL